MTTTQTPRRPAPAIGSKVCLPDGPYGPVVRVEAGTEHGDPVWYVTVRSSLGNEVTRWVR